MKKADLQKALEIVKPGLANKEMIEQSTSFAFVEGRVVTYNDEISLSHPVEGLGITGAIKADGLYQLLNKITKEEIEITVDKNEVLIKAGRIRAGLTLQKKIKLPLDEIESREKWKTLPEDFIRFMSFAMSSCSRDMSRPILTCVHVNKKGYIESSDGHRITRCEMEEKMPVDTFLIPASTVQQVVKLKPTKISGGKSWVHFKTDEGSVMSCRVYEDEYPDTSIFLEVEGVDITFPKTMEDVLERASVFSKRDYTLDEMVELCLEDNRLKIKSQSDAGWFKESVNMKYTDLAVTFSIAPYLLKGILSETSTCVLCEDRLKFQGAGWVHIALLTETAE